MSRLRFNIREFESVPDGFRYTHPETGHTDRHVHKEVWLRMIRDHLRRMNLPIPDDIDAIAEDQCCRLLPPGFCVYADGSNPDRYINTRIGVDEIVNGTKVLASFIAHGMPVVEQSLAEARGKTCASCYANIATEGCSACRNFVSVVMEVSGNRKTSSDPYLERRACGVCKCATQAQIWLPIEILAKGMTPEMDSLWPAHCWKKNERDALTETSQSL